MTILALDLGTTTGFAAGTPGALAHGSVKFQTGRYEGGGMRYLKFRRWLRDTLIDLGGAEVTAVYYEEVRRHRGTDAAHVYGGFLSHLTEICEAAKIPYAGVPVGTIKKHATGSGNANKAQMVAAVRKIGFEEVIDDNEADAIALFFCAISEHHPELMAIPKLDDMMA